MFIEIVPKIGGKPLRIEAAQVIVYTDQQDPVMVAGEYGMAGGIRTAHVHDKDFDQTLRAFGYRGNKVKVTTVTMPPVPAGARLLSAP